MSQTKTNSEVIAVATEVKVKGRPVNTNSVRQQKLAEKAEFIANGGSTKRGRPTAPDSKRQTKLAAREARIAAGLGVRPGRPKKVAVEPAA